MAESLGVLQNATRPKSMYDYPQIYEREGMKLGQMGEPYSCVIAHLDLGGDLLEANRRLRFLPHVDSFLEYRAHVTLAYVREEYTDRAVQALNDVLGGMELTATGINYGGELKD